MTSWGGDMSTAETSPPPTLSRSGDWAAESSWGSRVLGLLKLGPVLVGGVLLYAGFSKAKSPDLTIESLSWAFDGAVWPILFALVAIEIILGTCLVFRVWPRWSIAASLMLFLAFSGWLVYLHMTNAPVPCGCGDDPSGAPPSAESRWWALSRNGGFLALLATGLVLEVRRPSKEKSVGFRARDGA